MRRGMAVFIAFVVSSVLNKELTSIGTILINW